MTSMDRDQIAAMIPHAGAMCLLDSVLSWDAASIRCLSRFHKRQDNPLRRSDGSLSAVCGVEVAAQAMAVHGFLVAANAGPPSQGYLASVRDVRLNATHLELVAGDITVDVERLMGDDSGATYRFALAGEGTEIVSGRATVVLGIVAK